MSTVIPIKVLRQIHTDEVGGNCQGAVESDTGELCFSVWGCVPVDEHCPLSLLSSYFENRSLLNLTTTDWLD